MNGGVIINEEDLGEGKSVHEVLGEKLGMELTAEQVDKYYNKETGEYDFKSHLVEQNFKAAQAKGKDEADPEPVADPAQAAKDADAAQKAVENAGLDFGAVQGEILETGELKADTRRALNDAGIPDDVIAQYINGVEDTAVVRVAEAMAYLGGDQGIEELKDLVDKAGWSKEKRGEIEVALATEDWKKAADELLALKGSAPAKSADNNDADPDEPANDGVVPFKDQEELSLAIADPRYREKSAVGRAYREEVAQRAAASTYALNPRSHSVGF